jgi:hypothetical protein
MSPISSGIVVGRRSHRLVVRQNGRLSVSQGHSLASNCPDISHQPADIPGTVQMPN